MRELNKKDKYDKLLTSYVSSLRERSDKRKLEEFATFRDFSVRTIEDCGIFYIESMTEMLLPQYLDNLDKLGVISEANNKPIFNKRYVIPIRTEEGLVQGLVGYSADANERYIYGTPKYYRRKETLYGLENLELAYKMGYAILTEGITDTIRLRDMGYANTFAMCGTHGSSYIMRQLNRCRHGVIRIPDRDDAGLRALKQWDLNRHVTLMVNLQYKDVDEMCRNSEENKEWLNSYLKDCINWITSDRHRGQHSICETVTVM